MRKGNLKKASVETQHELWWGLPMPEEDSDNPSFELMLRNQWLASRQAAMGSSEMLKAMSRPKVLWLMPEEKEIETVEDLVSLQYRKWIIAHLEYRAWLVAHKKGISQVLALYDEALAACEEYKIKLMESLGFVVSPEKHADGNVLDNPWMLINWDYDKNDLRPDEVPVTSNYRARWVSWPDGYEWSEPVCDRFAGDGSVPDSLPEQIDIEDDLLSLYPDISKDWDFEKNNCSPTEVCATDKTVAHWHCNKCGFEWTESIYARTHGKECPNCNSKENNR